MLRTSSPGTYGRTSSNSTPRPLKTETYSPASTSATWRPVRTWISRTRRRISLASMEATPTCGSGYEHAGEDPLDHVLALPALCLGLVGQRDAMAQHVEGEGLH